MVGAVAGSGKTTTLEGIVAHLPSKAKIAVLAFNVHIVNELKGRLPSAVTVCTAHSMGRAILTRYFGGLPPQIEEHKYRSLCDAAASSLVKKLASARNRYEQVIRENPQDAERLYPHPPPLLAADERGLVRSLSNFLQSLCRFTQITLSSTQQSALLDLIDNYSIENPFEDLTPWVLPQVAEILRQGEEQAQEDQIVSFEDLIWLPNHWQIQPVAKDFVLIDEAQDANAAMLGLYLSFAKLGARLIVVGDERQAIMGFSGSASDSWQRIREALWPNLTELPLSVCYRCPSSHLDLARRIVPQIEANPEHQFSPGELSVVPPKQIKNLTEAGDLIVARTTAPVVDLCLKLIISGTKAKVRGRDVGKGLIDIVRNASVSTFPGNFLMDLAHYCQPRIDGYIALGKDAVAESLKDKKRAIEACFQVMGYECRSVDAFCSRIAALFADEGEQSPVILSTIHRAKGATHDRVFLLGSNQLPFTFFAKQDWEFQQEWNLVYVALTRARRSLFLVPLPSKQDPDITKYLRHPLGGLQLPTAETQEDFISEVEPAFVSESGLRPGSLVRFRNDNPAYAPFEVLEVLAERVRVTHPSWKYDQGLLKGRLITDLRPIDQIEEITHA